MSFLPSAPPSPPQVGPPRTLTPKPIVANPVEICEDISDIQKHIRTLGHSDSVTLMSEPKLSLALGNMELEGQTIASWHANIVHPLTRCLGEYHVELKTLLSKLDVHTQMLEQKLLKGQSNEAMQMDGYRDEVHTGVDLDAMVTSAVDDLISGWKTFSHLLGLALEGFELSLTQHSSPWAVDTKHKLLCKTRQINLVTHKLARATFSFEREPAQLGFRIDVEKARMSSQALQTKVNSIVTNINHLVRNTLPHNISWSRMASDTATRECSVIEEQGDSISEGAIKTSRALLLVMLNEWALRRRLFVCEEF